MCTSAGAQVGGVGAVVWPPQAAESKGWLSGQQNILMKKGCSLCSKNFKLLNQIIGNSINNCDFLKVHDLS
jgi:hypothetical protein